MHLVWCQLRPEEIGHDERRADREEVRWLEPCERVTHALPDLPAWPVRIGSGRRGQQSERPGGEHLGQCQAVSATRAPGNFEGAASGRGPFILLPFYVHATGHISPPALPAACVPPPVVLETACAISSAALSLRTLSPSSRSPARRVSGGSCSSTAARCRPPWRGRP